KLDSAGLHHLGEVGVLAQQAIAGIDRVHIGDLGGADHGGNVQIAVAQPRRPDADGFVGKPHVQRVAIGLAVNSHRADAQFLAGADYAERDFPAIGDEDLLEHSRVLTVGFKKSFFGSSTTSAVPLPAARHWVLAAEGRYWYPETTFELSKPVLVRLLFPRANREQRLPVFH